MLINGPELAAAIHPWRLELLDETGSTNTDAIEAARRGTPEGLVILAESQASGRGRLGREWVSPHGAGLWLSILVRPSVEMARWGWLPLLAGLALAETVNDLYAIDAGLKWPNDLLIDGRKCAGILAEAAVPGAVVVGVGLNVRQTEEQLPSTPSGLPATSLQLAGVADIDRTALAAKLITRFRSRYISWQSAPDELRAGYVKHCWTLGRKVLIAMPDGRQITGEATTVDGDGRLVIRDDRGELCPIAAGDVTHVR